MKKGSIYQEDIRILNVYVSNKRDSQYKQQKSYRTERRTRYIYKYSKRFQHPLSIIDTTNRKKISKDMEDLNNTIKQLDLTDIYGTLIQLDQVNHSF